MTVLFTDLFTGTNGANWSSTLWDYKYFQFGGVGDINSNRGRMVTGSIGSGNDYGTYRSAASFTNFRARFDYTVSGTSTSGGYLAFGFRASNTWIAGQMIADACYYLEFTRGATPLISLKKRVGGVTTELESTTMTMANNDVMHARIIANGSSIKARVWKNATPEPIGQWNCGDVVDTAHTSGKFFVSCYGGTNTATETFYIDNLVVDDVLEDLGDDPAPGCPIGTGAAFAPTISAVNGATPTLFAETWTGSNGAAWPAQWTTTTSGTGTVADIQSNRGRMATGTGVYGKVGARNTTALASDDYTLTVDVVIPTVSEWYFFVHVRGSSTFNNTYQLLSSYQFRFTLHLNTIIPELYQVDGSGVATLAGAGALTGSPVAGDTVRIKIEVSGTSTTTLKQKAWILGAAEPGYTDLSAAATTAYTGDYFALSAQGGNNLVSEDFLWDNLTVTSPDDGTADAQAATGTALAVQPLASTQGRINAGLASSHGEAMFDGAGPIQSLSLEALDAVEAHGEAFGAQKAHNAGAATGAGTAYNATVAIAGANTTLRDELGNAILDESGDPIVDENFAATATDANATVAAGVGVANNSTVTRTGNTLNTATATAAGTAVNPTVSITGNISATAAAAVGTGYGTGFAYLLGEDGAQILDESGAPLVVAGTSVSVAFSPSSATGVSAVAAQTSTKPAAGVSAGVGAALQPGTTSTAPPVTTVNADAATSAGAALTATSSLAASSNVAASTGTASAQSSVAAQADVGAGVGSAHMAARRTEATVAAGSVVAYDAQADIDANNFASAAAIPIAAAADTATVALLVTATAALSTGAAHTAGPQTENEPGQLITIRDRGHTVTLKER